MVARISYWIVEFLDGWNDERDVEISFVFKEAFRFLARARLAKDRQTLLVEATIRCFAPSVQRLRRPVSTTSRRRTPGNTSLIMSSMHAKCADHITQTMRQLSEAYRSTDNGLGAVLICSVLYQRPNELIRFAIPFLADL